MPTISNWTNPRLSTKPENWVLANGKTHKRFLRPGGSCFKALSHGGRESDVASKRAVVVGVVVAVVVAVAVAVGVVVVVVVGVVVGMTTYDWDETYLAYLWPELE